MSHTVDHFVDMWRAQPLLLILWSVVCILIGAIFAVTLYWYRVRYVVRRADAQLVVLSELGEAGDRRVALDRRQMDRRTVNES